MLRLCGTVPGEEGTHTAHRVPSWFDYTRVQIHRVPSWFTPCSCMRRRWAYDQPGHLNSALIAPDSGALDFVKACAPLSHGQLML